MSRAAPGKYHETITWAFAFVVRQRITKLPPAHTWEEFCAHNADLLAWPNSVLDRYYTRDVLGSALAKQVFVLPESGPMSTTDTAHSVVTERDPQAVAPGDRAT
jgi:hypothetical protein